MKGNSSSRNSTESTVSSLHSPQLSPAPIGNINFRSFSGHRYTPDPGPAFPKSRPKQRHRFIFQHGLGWSGRGSSTGVVVAIGEMWIWGYRYSSIKTLPNFVDSEPGPGEAGYESQSSINHLIDHLTKLDIYARHVGENCFNIDRLVHTSTNETQVSASNSTCMSSTVAIYDLPATNANVARQVSGPRRATIILNSDLFSRDILWLSVKMNIRYSQVEDHDFSVVLQYLVSTVCYVLSGWWVTEP